MKRIPEPELMDAPEQARAYAGADFSEPHNMFVEKFTECFPHENITGNVLDLGCGPADITIRFARAYTSCKITGVDGAQEMVLLGRKAIEKAALSERISLIKGLLQELNQPESVYSVIISNSLLHHLHHPDDLWTCIKKSGVTGTLVFVMDLMRPATEAIASELVETYAGDAPEVLRQDFYNSLCAAYLPGEVSTQIRSAGLNQLKVDIIPDRHMIIYGCL